MNAGDGAPWSAAKRKIAEELQDLTLVWNVGPKGRAQAHASGVTRWSEPRASAAVLGVSGGAAATVDAVLDTNRARSGPVVRPGCIRGDGGGWKEPAPVELFVDFETVNDLADDFSSIPKRGGQALIFQIGCVRKGKEGWEVDWIGGDGWGVAGGGTGACGGLLLSGCGRFSATGPASAPTGGHEPAPASPVAVQANARGRRVRPALQ